MKHLFVSYEIAKKLKEKGFDKNCFRFWKIEHRLYESDKIEAAAELITDDEKYLIIQKDLDFKFILAPLYQQVIDWFREKHKIVIGITYLRDVEEDLWYFDIVEINKNYDTGTSIDYKTYYKALNAAIEESIKLI